MFFPKISILNSIIVNYLISSYVYYVVPHQLRIQWLSADS